MRVITNGINLFLGDHLTAIGLVDIHLHVELERIASDSLIHVKLHSPVVDIDDFFAQLNAFEQHGVIAGVRAETIELAGRRGIIVLRFRVIRLKYVR